MLAFSWPAFPGVHPSWYAVIWLSLAGLGMVLAGLGIWLGIRRKRETSLPPPAPEQPVVPPTEEVKESVLPTIEIAPLPVNKNQLRSGLNATRLGFVAKLAGLLRKKQIDAHVLENLEEILLTADVGVQTAQFLFERVREQLTRSQLTDGDEVLRVLKEESRKMLEIPAATLNFSEHQPYVILVLGVNGVGKTTSIGKLSSQFKQSGKRVLLAAGDTFRAAAVEQLAIWGERVGVDVVKGKEGGDPSAVIFSAIQEAQKQGHNVVLADTAGRLHVKAQLMEELQKVRRVIKKADPTAPHQTWLVLDATTGQNAIAQARTFKELMDITGIILTKLDGTAKGGVVLGICHELQIPVRYIGVGEKAEDLQLFDSDSFIEALYEESTTAAEGAG